MREQERSRLNEHELLKTFEPGPDWRAGTCGNGGDAA